MTDTDWEANEHMAECERQVERLIAELTDTIEPNWRDTWFLMLRDVVTSERRYREREMADTTDNAST